MVYAKSSPCRDRSTCLPGCLLMKSQQQAEVKQFKSSHGEMGKTCSGYGNLCLNWVLFHKLLRKRAGPWVLTAQERVTQSSLQEVSNLMERSWCTYAGLGTRSLE